MLVKQLHIFAKLYKNTYLNMNYKTIKILLKDGIKV